MSWALSICRLHLVFDPGSVCSRLSPLYALPMWEMASLCQDQLAGLDLSIRPQTLHTDLASTGQSVKDDPWTPLWGPMRRPMWMSSGSSQMQPFCGVMDKMCWRVLMWFL